MDNRCVFCGETVPEGWQVCPSCAEQYSCPAINYPKTERRKPWLFKRLRQMKAILLSCLTGKSNQR